jgi:leader peptidase (prepilin peptidase) / N-methyltransferase
MMHALPLLTKIYGPEIASDPMFIAFIAASAFAFGSVIGSFLNVCISRLPVVSIVSQYRKADDETRTEILAALDGDPAAAKEMIEEMTREDIGIVRPRSRCPNCRNSIAWHDNVPIASWLLLRAKCRHCAQPISIVYPLVEMLCGLALAYLVLRFDIVVGAIYFLFFGAMVVVTGVDLLIYEIPDEIVFPGIPLGLLASAVLPTTFTEALIGAIAGGGVIWLIGAGHYLLTKKHGMGFGDVKLFAMVGAFFGWKGVLAALLVASFVGSIAGISLVVFRKRHFRTEIPFGPFIALGSIIYMLAGPQLLEFYQRLFGG